MKSLLLLRNQILIIFIIHVYNKHNIIIFMYKEYIILKVLIIKINNAIREIKGKDS